MLYTFYHNKEAKEKQKLVLYNSQDGKLKKTITETQKTGDVVMAQYRSTLPA